MPAQEDPGSKIATKKELQDLVAQRPQPKPTMTYTPEGPIRKAVDEPIADEAAQKREARIKELAQKLGAQHGRAKGDFEREP